MSSKKDNKKNIRWLKQDDKIDSFIIAQTANIEMQKIIETLSDAVKKELTIILGSSLAPTFEYKHVNEQGLRIWGKAENVAISKTTFIEILDNLKSVAKSEAEYENALYLAGSKSALGFFDQFINILSPSENELNIPSNVVDFLNVLGSFDSKSAWWEKIQYGEEKDYLEITIYKPFWRYPWFETSNHHYTSFIAGYLLTLHNCCYDFIHVVSDQEGHIFNDHIGIKIEIYQDPDFTQSHLKLTRFDKYIKDLLDIDKIIFDLSDWLSSNSEFEDNRDNIYNKFEELVLEIEKVLSLKITKANGTLKEVKDNYRKNSPDYLRNIFYQLLNDIRIEYNKLRIQKFIGK
jgi:hypothetical protein